MKINSNLENKIDDRSGVHNGKLTGERILLLKEAKKAEELPDKKPHFRTTRNEVLI